MVSNKIKTFHTQSEYSIGSEHIKVFFLWFLIYLNEILNGVQYYFDDFKFELVSNAAAVQGVDSNKSAKQVFRL